MCRQRMFFTPLSIRSTISPVRSQPSPHWFPIEMNFSAFLAVSSIRQSGVKRLLFLHASLEYFLYDSMKERSALLMAMSFHVPERLL